MLHQKRLIVRRMRANGSINFALPLGVAGAIWDDAAATDNWHDAGQRKSICLNSIRERDAYRLIENWPRASIARQRNGAPFYPSMTREAA